MSKSEFLKWSEKDHLEWFEERAALLEFDGGMTRRRAEKTAYWQWRQHVGKGIPAPQKMQQIVNG
jgi:hypothetical protein